MRPCWRGARRPGPDGCSTGPLITARLHGSTHDTHRERPAALSMKAISPLTDFSFDFQDLDLRRLK